MGPGIDVNLTLTWTTKLNIVPDKAHILNGSDLSYPDIIFCHTMKIAKEQLEELMALARPPN